MENIEKQIQQKIHELHNLCEENGRQLLVIVDAKGTEDGRYMNVWSIGNSKHKEVNKENQGELLGPFIHAIDSFVRAATGGVCIISINKDVK